MNRVAVALTVAAFSLPAPILAQAPDVFDPGTPTGTIEGRVTTDGATGLADVSVVAPGDRWLGTISDQVGRFSLEGLLPGPTELRLERIGFTSSTVTVNVRPGATTRVVVSMSMQAIALDAVDVTVRGEPLYLEVNGFYRRSERGFGHQLSRGAMDGLRMREVADAVQRVPGVELRHDPYAVNRVIAMRPREQGIDGRRCELTVYIDGVRTLDPDINQVSPDWLVAMEVYLGADTPVRYRTAESCGAVLLWTRRY